MHVRIIAPFEIRTRRLLEQKGCNEKEAERILQESDRDSSGYISSFFRVDWENSYLYDLIIDTKTISMNTGIELITGAVNAPEFLEGAKETADKVADLVLKQKVEAALVDFPELKLANLHIESGILNLSGSVNSQRTIETIKQATADIKGIKSVNNQLFVRKIE